MSYDATETAGEKLPIGTMLLLRYCRNQKFHSKLTIDPTPRLSSVETLSMPDHGTLREQICWRVIDLPNHLGGIAEILEEDCLTAFSVNAIHDGP
jgi:hypothetical protein